MIDISRYQLEAKEEWHMWGDKIPYIKWPADWEVKAIPPFAGAMIRYMVKKPDGAKVSIYLDVFERLGHYGKPHWEVYPVADNNERCDMEDVTQLLKYIEESEGL